MGRRIQVSPGDQYGLLTIVKEVECGRTPGGQTFRRLLCRCNCGAKVVVKLAALRSENTRACGCLRDGHPVHGRKRRGTSDLTYRCWMSMTYRCRNTNSKDYKNYGGRGISVCRRWRDSFLAFIEDMGECPGKGYTIERISNEAGYEPGNCKWATRKEQGRNKRNNVMLTFNGETMCLIEWAERIRMNRMTLSYRLRSGWTIEEALTTPVGQKRMDLPLPSSTRI